MQDQVLLISDNPQAGDIWAHALGDQGVDVVLVGSGQDPLRCWSENGRDAGLIVIDVGSPQLDGTALTRRLRAVTDEPILLLMPGGDELPQLEAYQSGVDECIVKPISPLMLVAKVQAWLRYQRTLIRAPGPQFAQNRDQP
jgi:two-component system KDP operon response regulator KdpE